MKRPAQTSESDNRNSNGHRLALFAEQCRMRQPHWTHPFRRLPHRRRDLSQEPEVGDRKHIPPFLDIAVVGYYG
jgi:hypothetical protein